jgi:hypothetical protein
MTTTSTGNWDERAFISQCTLVACNECEIYEHFDRWGEAEMFMDDHNREVHGDG